jgi:hypothetical protein
MVSKEYFILKRVFTLAAGTPGAVMVTSHVKTEHIIRLEIEATEIAWIALGWLNRRVHQSISGYISSSRVVVLTIRLIGALHEDTGLLLVFKWRTVREMDG